MQKHRAYYFNALGDCYTAESEPDEDGQFYLASEVDARIEELEKALRGMLDDDGMASREDARRALGLPTEL